MKRNNISIGVLGLWHLGCVYSASFAKQGYDVTCFDFDKKIVSNLKKKIPPIYEPNLDEIIKTQCDKNLHFTSSEEEAIKNKDYVFITYDVPVNQNDIIQLKVIRKTFAILPKYLSEKTTIVISSQIPVGTSRSLIDLLKTKGIQNPRVIYFPENLRLGKAFSFFLSPDRIILGSDKKMIMNDFKKDFSFFKCPVIEMSLESAEMVKHALNTYLATCISFSSEISDLSERIGANMLDIVKALKTDKRVSPFAPINPGLGFAGGTLGRDIQTLRMIARNKNYKTKLLDSVYSVNQARIPMLLGKIITIYPLLKGMKIGILGLTYKANTNTLRRSQALELAVLLKQKGCRIKAFDPAIKKNITSYPFIKVCDDLKTFFKDLDLIILMTEWSEFKEMHLSKLSSFMRKRVVIDTKNFLESSVYINNNFDYQGIGI